MCNCCRICGHSCMPGWDWIFCPGHSEPEPEAVWTMTDTEFKRALAGSAATALREAAQEDFRLHAIGKTPTGEVSTVDRAAYWAHQEITTADWLDARAVKIESEMP